MAETRKRRRLSESGSFQAEDAALEVPKDDMVAEQQTTSSSKRQSRRTLFVRSLPASATTESLTEYFSQSYVLKHATSVLDPQTKQSKGYGFVTFADIEDAQRALEEFNGSVFDGKKIKVEYAEPRHREIDEKVGKSVPAGEALKLKEERERRKTESQPPKLIVRNLPWSIKEPDDLAALFRSYGKVKHAVIPKKGNALAGFGFVVMRGKKNAERALEAVNGKEVDERTLAVDWAVEKSVWESVQKSTEEDADDVEADQDKAEEGQEAEPASQDEEDGPENGMREDMSGDSEAESGDEDVSMDDEDLDMDENENEDEDEDEKNASTVFIRNLPFTSTDETLYDHFTQFGRLRYARIVVDPETERPKGTGFVCFGNFEDAVACVRNGPKQADTIAVEKGKTNKSTTLKHSVLQNESADPSGQYTMDGRVLQVTRAVSRSQASRLQEEGVSKRLARDKDKRRLYLLSEGTIPSNSGLYQKLSPTEIKMREDSLKQRQTLIKNNPTLHLSLTRLSIRNVPRHVSSKDLKALAREAVVGFAKDVKAGHRQPLSREELKRSGDALTEEDKLRKKKGLGIVKQAKIVFEGRDGSKIEEKSGTGRSRGYGFIEYATHRNALMGLRWLNGHAVDANSEKDVNERKKRLIVEFAIENAQVVKRRNENQAKARSFSRSSKANDEAQADGKGEEKAWSEKSKRGMKRKRPESSSSGKNVDVKDKGGEEGEKDNKIAKRNRIIAKKRMQRKGRKGKA